MARFKRNQVEEAIYAIKRGLTQEILNRIKRLLDTDRNLGRNRRSRDAARTLFAFFSDEGSGRGVEVWFHEYEAFALLLAVNLLGHGFPQQTCVEILRRLRLPLEVEHGRILRQPFRPFDPKAPGQLAVDTADPVYVVVTNATGSSDKGKSETAICNGDKGLMQHMKSVGVGMTFTIIEIAAAAHSFHKALLETQPSQRGRPPR